LGLIGGLDSNIFCPEVKLELFEGRSNEWFVADS